MKNLDFTPILQDWGNLLTDVQDKIQNNWNEEYSDEKVNGGQLTIQTFLKVAIVHYSGVLHLCTLSEKNNYYFYLNVPPINRSILEILFTVIFLLEDFPENNKLILKNFLRESHEFLEFYRDTYGGNEKYDQFIAESVDKLDRYEAFLETIIELTPSEKTTMQNWQRMPRVSGIVKYFEKRNAPISSLLSYLEKLHYLRLSHLSHLQPFGIVSLQKVIFKPEKKDVVEFITEHRWIALTLIITLISEIELHFNFGLKNKINYFWKIFQQSSDYTKEIYEMRYEKLLNS